MALPESVERFWLIIGTWSFRARGHLVRDGGKGTMRSSCPGLPSPTHKTNPIDKT